jgi:hypothetical protein
MSEAGPETARTTAERVGVTTLDPPDPRDKNGTPGLPPHQPSGEQSPADSLDHHFRHFRRAAWATCSGSFDTLS